MSEEWRDIPGFEGIYQISNLGRLKSYKQSEAGKIMKQTNARGGYFSVVLQGKGVKTRSTRIHRLVAEAFISNPDNLPEVNHKDGDKQNNRADNLEWCSKSYNIRHSIKMHPKQLNPMIYYNKILRPNPIVQLCKDGTIVNRFDNGADASRSTGVCQRNILQAANGTPNERGYKRKSAGGFIWRFESEVMQK